MHIDRRSALASRIALAVIAASMTMAALVAAAPPPAAPVARLDAAALLARFKAVTGGDAWDAIRALHTSGNVETGGLSGTFDVWEELGTGRGTGRFHLGPMSGAEGFDGDAPWSQDAKGEVTVQRGEEALEAARNEAYRTTLAWWYPERWPAEMRRLDDRREDERTFAIVEITPRGGRPFELWLDEASGLPDRAVERGGLETIVTRLGALPSGGGGRRARRRGDGATGERGRAPGAQQRGGEAEGERSEVTAHRCGGRGAGGRHAGGDYSADGREPRAPSPAPVQESSASCSRSPLRP
jgi:hypothetical protein